MQKSVKMLLFFSICKLNDNIQTSVLILKPLTFLEAIFKFDTHILEMDSCSKFVSVCLLLFSHCLGVWKKYSPK